LVTAAKFLVAATKNLFVVPIFVAVTKLFFSVYTHYLQLFFLKKNVIITVKTINFAFF